MSQQLYIIKNDNKIIGYYTDINTAKRELKKIDNETVDYRTYGYQINVYNEVDNEYINTNKIYTYNSNIFFTVNWYK